MYFNREKRETDEANSIRKHKERNKNQANI